MDMKRFNDQTSSEKLITLAQAAAELGVPYWKVQRAAKMGLFPVYRFYNGRLLVLISQVWAAIKPNGSRPFISTW